MVRRFFASLGVASVAAICLLSFAAEAHAVPPANDSFANSQTLTDMPLTVTGNNVGATREAGEPNHNPYDPGFNTIWYSWTATSSGNVAVDLNGSGYDHYIAAYTGSAVGSLTRVDAVGNYGNGLDSKLYFPATSGVTYRFAIYNYNSGTGPTELALFSSGSISGVVTDDTGLPVKDACVRYYDYSGTSSTVIYTDAGGAYSFDGLTPGNYRIGFSYCGIMRLKLANEFFDGGLTLATAKKVRVTAGSAATNIDARLAPGGSISGKVIDSQGAKLFGICVDAYDSNGRILDNGTSNSNATFHLDGLVAGDYRLRFYGCDGADFAVEYYNDKPSLATAEPVTVTAGAETTTADVQMLPTGGSIAGSVTGNSDLPQPGVCVNAYGSDGRYEAGDVTDAGGGYAIAGLEGGNHRIRFRMCDPGSDLATEYYSDKASLETAGPVEVTAGSVTANVNARLLQGGSISGTVTDSSDLALNDICVDAYDADGVKVDGDDTNFSGEYSIRQLPVGSYRVRFHDCGSGFFASEYFSDQPGISTGGQVAVTAATDTSGIDAQLVPDTVAPDTVIDSGPTGTITTNEATFAVSASPADDIDRLDCSIDGGAFANCSSPKTFAGLGEGSHTAAFRAEDAAGNQDATPATSTFTVDTSIPVAAKARIGKVKVSGPARVRKGKPATYKVKVTNSGNAAAKGVKLKVSGKGIVAKASPGKIAASTTRTVKVKVRPKKTGMVKATFKVTSGNAGGRTAKKRITVRK